MTSTVDTTIFEGGSSFDWETYLRCRPDYRQSNFYPIIWQYHNSHNGSYDLAYDVGTGPGNVAEVLASSFERVEASDMSAFHVSVARQRHKELANAAFSHSRAEDLSGDKIADLVTVAECLPLMEIEKAISTFRDLLKPGGTLAIWFYGGPIYTGHDTATSEIQKLHRDITSRSFDQLRPLKGPTWSTIGSWLDNVALLPGEWKDVRRVKWNAEYPLGFSEDFKNDMPSAIGSSETMEKISDPTFWAKDVDFAWAKGFIDAQIPRKESYLTAEVEIIYAKMEELMGGKEHPITWPAILILATRT
jgi:trans-aconitate 3-methyltransferase